MSLGGPELDAVEQAAIDYAISKGVILVASAGNQGEAGMGYPGGMPDYFGGSFRMDRRMASWRRRRRRKLVECRRCGGSDQRKRLLHHGFFEPPPAGAGSRRGSARLVGGRAVPVAERKDELLLPRRHVDGQSSRRGHRRADGAEESFARRGDGRNDSGIQRHSAWSGVPDRRSAYRIIRNDLLGRRRDRLGVGDGGRGAGSDAVKFFLSAFIPVRAVRYDLGNGSYLPWVGLGFSEGIADTDSLTG